MAEGLTSVLFDGTFYAVMTFILDKFFDFKYFSGGDAEQRPERLNVLPAQPAPVRQ